MAAEERGRRGPGPALCGVPADKASKLGCIHKSLNTHAFHTHSRQIQFPNQGLTGNPPYSSACLHVCVCEMYVLGQEWPGLIIGCLLASANR